MGNGRPVTVADIHWVQLPAANGHQQRCHSENDTDQPQPVSTFTLPDSFEFLDVMTAGTVIRVAGEGAERFGVVIDKLGVTPGQGFE